MQDSQIKLLFARLDRIEKQLSGNQQAEGEVLNKLQLDMLDMKRMVQRATANSELVVDGYKAHGTDIERLTRSMEKLRLSCPLLKQKTDEFLNVVQAAEKKG